MNHSLEEYHHQNVGVCYREIKEGKIVDSWSTQYLRDPRTQIPQRSHTTPPTHLASPQATSASESHPHPSPAAQPNNGSDDQ